MIADRCRSFGHAAWVTLLSVQFACAQATPVETPGRRETDPPASVHDQSQDGATSAAASNKVEIRIVPHFTYGELAGREWLNIHSSIALAVRMPDGTPPGASVLIGWFDREGKSRYFAPQSFGAMDDDGVVYLMIGHKSEVLDAGGKPAPGMTVGKKGEVKLRAAKRVLRSELNQYVGYVLSQGKVLTFKLPNLSGDVMLNATNDAVELAGTESPPVVLSPLTSAGAFDVMSHDEARNGKRGSERGASRFRKLREGMYDLTDVRPDHRAVALARFERFDLASTLVNECLMLSTAADGPAINGAQTVLHAQGAVNGEVLLSAYNITEKHLGGAKDDYGNLPAPVESEQATGFRIFATCELKGEVRFEQDLAPPLIVITETQTEAAGWVVASVVVYDKSTRKVSFGPAMGRQEIAKGVRGQERAIDTFASQGLAKRDQMYRGLRVHLWSPLTGLRQQRVSEIAKSPEPGGSQRAADGQRFFVDSAPEAKFVFGPSDVYTDDDATAALLKKCLQSRKDFAAELQAALASAKKK